MEATQLLDKIYSIEKSLGVDNVLINRIPIWRIVRYSTRLNYLTAHSDYVAGTATVRTVGKRRLKLTSGFWKYIKEKELNIFFPFNRLVENNGLFLDKFVDPLIEESDLNKGNNVIVDSPNYRGAFGRLHKDICIQQENRTILSQLLKYACYGITRTIYRKRIVSLFKLAQEPFSLPENFINKYYKSISLFLANYTYYLLWFAILRPRRVFVVLRVGYLPVIVACKKLGIPVAELQHGITMDKTVSYTGDYDQRIDPDYFLVFGEYWKGPQFGMPLERIINIGWAYSKYLQKTIAENKEKHDKAVLVISSPEISDAILDTLQELSKNEGDFSFDIRLHPCESYNEAQLEKLKAIPKARVVDNKSDSALVLPTYKYVVGENSSVIYEALSVGCKVGMLNMCGLRPAVDLPGIKDNFFIISNCEDFEMFLTEDSTQSTSKAEFYSEFDNKRFKEFIENKM